MTERIYNMKKLYFNIDATSFTSKKEAHTLMQKVFYRYEYYGSNLDALHDVLTSIRIDAKIKVNGLAYSEKYIGDYAERIKEVFMDSAEENPHLKFVFTEPKTK